MLNNQSAKKKSYWSGHIAVPVERGQLNRGSQGLQPQT